MSFTISSIAAGLIFGAFGIYFLKRGKNDADFLLLFVGITLIAFPYFIENDLLLWGIGVALLAFGFKTRGI